METYLPQWPADALVSWPNMLLYGALALLALICLRVPLAIRGLRTDLERQSETLGRILEHLQLHGAAIGPPPPLPTGRQMAAESMGAYSGPTPPLGARPGRLWFDTGSGRLMEFNGMGWEAKA
jgi:hypothetical protein